MARDLPDPSLTPGEINAEVTSDNIDENICVSGWTTTVRPSVSYTNKLKKTQIDQYGYTDKDPRDYEEDHLISLQLGGSPTSPKNLWPEPYEGPCGARVKDRLETKLKKMICDGEIDLETAQDEIAKDWVGAFNKYIEPLTCP